MSEAEAYELFTLIAEHLNQLLFGYFSVVTAFLMMSYYVAEKLDRFLAVIIVTLYTACCTWFFAGLYGWANDLSLLYVDIVNKKAEGIYELNWFGSNPIWLSYVVTTMQQILTFGGWLISVAYFYYKRRKASTIGGNDV